MINYDIFRNKTFKIKLFRFLSTKQTTNPPQH